MILHCTIFVIFLKIYIFFKSGSFFTLEKIKKVKNIYIFFLNGKIWVIWVGGSVNQEIKKKLP